MYEVSVVLPVYNIKRNYLTKAVESLLAQTFQNFELLMIDDGSNKETAALCDELAARDERIKLFHNENKGPGKSRNFGLSQTQGKYIIFMDHDDWAEPDWLKKLHDSLIKNNSEVAFCYADEYFEDKDVFEPIPYPHFGIEKMKLNAKFRHKIANSFFPPWAKMVRKDVIEKYRLRFAEDGNRFDDVLFHVFLIEYATKISFIDEVLYHHRMFANSITVTSSVDTDMYFDVFKTIESVIEKCKVDGSSAKDILNRNIYFFCSAVDVVKSKKEFVQKMSFYIMKLGLENALYKIKMKKIKRWLFTINSKKGILRIFGIYLLNKSNES